MFPGSIFDAKMGCLFMGEFGWSSRASQGKEFHVTVRIPMGNVLSPWESLKIPMGKTHSPWESLPQEAEHGRAEKKMKG